MVCPGCGTENRSSRRFCLRCGRALAATCDACGAPNEREAAFCGECGVQLGGASRGRGAPAAVEAAPAPVAERRLVTVLFTDLVGFTPFAEERDAEEVRETLARYFELAAGVIGRHGGTVEKFIGDAVMAVWGAPIAGEDDAERAVRAGLEIVDAIPALGPTMQARAGIITGDAAVTLGAVGQGIVAGDIVTTASRLQAAAAPGTVLVGEATMRAASRAILFEPIGAQVLRGRSGPVPAWRAGPVFAERGGRGRADVLEPPLIGREEELRTLKDALHATGRDRRPRIVAITGLAGIGKSRLAWELEKYVDGVVEKVYWHTGFSPARDDGGSFRALREMVRRRAGLAAGTDEATTRVALDRLLAEYAQDDDDRRWIEPALLPLFGLAPPPPGGRNVLFAGWRMLFERIAERGTTVLVFEDLQGADDGTLAFVEHLLTWARSAPILVVALARPELLDRRPGWAAGAWPAASLALEPLAEDEMRRLVRGLVPGLPDGPLEMIVGRSAGVPLYAVETLRMLIVDGRLEPAGGTWRPTGDLGEIAVPETLRSLVAARLDALDPLDRIALEDAAVIGGSFDLEALAAVSGQSADALEARLEGLVRHELLTIVVEPHSPELGRYRFVEGLTREVAYGTLARRDRRARHLAAARHFQSLGREENAAVVAAHYLAAYLASAEGPEAAALAATARSALTAAARRAAALGALDQSVRYVEQALSVACEPAEAAALHEMGGASASALERVDDAEMHFRSAIELSNGLGDRVAAVGATAGYVGALLDGLRVERAIAVLVDASGRFADVDDAAALARLNNQRARALMMHDEHAEAVAVADRVLEAAERLGFDELVAEALVTRGSSLIALGRRHEGIGVIEAGRRLAAERAFRRTEVRALNNLASRLISSDPRASLKAARSGLDVVRRLGMRPSAIIDSAVVGAFRTGDWDWAADVLETSLEEELGPLTRALLLADLAVLRIARGEAVELLREELAALAATHDDWIAAIQVPWTLGWAAFADGRYDDARPEIRRTAAILEHNGVEVDPALAALAARCAILAGDGADAERALAAIPDGRGRALEAERATVRAGLAALDGRPQVALHLYRDALRAWRDLGCAWDEALCAVVMASLLDSHEAEVRAAAERAHGILAGLRARPFLQRLDTVLAGTFSADAATPSRGSTTSPVAATQPAG